MTRGALGPSSRRRAAAHLLPLGVPPLLVSAELLHLLIAPPLLALLLLPQVPLPPLLLWRRWKRRKRGKRGRRMSVLYVRVCDCLSV